MGDVSGATPSSRSGSRMSDRRATMPGSTTMSASPSRTRTIRRSRPCARPCSRHGAGGRRSWPAMVGRRGLRDAPVRTGARGARLAAPMQPPTVEAPCPTVATARPRPDRRAASRPWTPPARGRAPRRPRRRIVAVGSARGRAAHIGPSTRVIDLGPDRDARASRTRTSTRPRRPRGCAASCTRRAAATTYLAVIADYAAAIPTRPGSGAAAGTWTTSRAARPPRGPRRGRPDRPVFLTNATATAPGSTPGRSSSRHHRRHARPADGRIEREPDGYAERHPPRRARWTSSSARARRHPDRPGGGAAPRPGLPALAGHHRPGRTRSSRHRGARLRRPGRRGELTGRVVGAMWWERHRGAGQIEEFVERAPTSIGRYRATSVKLMMDGVLENFTGAMIEPYLDGTAATDNRGLSPVDPAA